MEKNLLDDAGDTRDRGSVCGAGRSPGEGIGYTPVFWPGEFPGLYSP